MLASKEMNWFTNQVKVQQPFPLSNRVPHSNTKQTCLFWSKSPKQRENKVSSCTHRSDLPYCMEPVGSYTLIPWSNCQALGQRVLLRGTWKGRSSGQVVLAAARTLPQNSPTGASCPPKTVTEPKLVLLTTQHAKNSRDKLLGQGIATLFGKPADREDGGLVPHRTTLPELEFRLLLY